MNNESLNAVLDLYLDNVHKMKIPIGDKLELLINLKQFLDPKNYANNIEVLQRASKKR